MRCTLGSVCLPICRIFCFAPCWTFSLQLSSPALLKELQWCRLTLPHYTVWLLESKWAESGRSILGNQLSAGDEEASAVYLKPNKSQYTIWYVKLCQVYFFIQSRGNYFLDCQCMKYKASKIYTLFIIPISLHSNEVYWSQCGNLPSGFDPSYFFARAVGWLEMSNCLLYIFKVTGFIYFCKMSILESWIPVLKGECQFLWREVFPIMFPTIFSIVFLRECVWNCCGREIWTQHGAYACIHYRALK